MQLLVIGLILFLGVHSISIVNPAWRDGMAARLGTLPWQGLYSLLALAGLLLIIQGYGQARLDPVVLYQPPDWLNHVTLVLMIFVFPLFIAAYLPGRIQTAARHPMLAATKIWAFAHLISNGTLADVVLFGAFLAWAVADRISLKRRTPLPVPALPATPLNDVIVIVLGLALYAVFLFAAHAWLFGVAPL